MLKNLKKIDFWKPTGEPNEQMKFVCTSEIHKPLVKLPSQRIEIYTHVFNNGEIHQSIRKLNFFRIFITLNQSEILVADIGYKIIRGLKYKCAKIGTTRLHCWRKVVFKSEYNKIYSTAKNSNNLIIAYL